MNKPTVDEYQAMSQAGGTIGTYLGHAIHEIDQRLGKGYAAKHPELMAAFISAAATDYHTTALTAVLYEIKEELGAKNIPRAPRS